MYAILENVLVILRGMWRFRWQAALAAWAVAVVGWAGVWLLPDTYETRARIFVDTDSVLKPLLDGLAVSSPVMPKVNMMATVLLSRPNVEKVARETDLYLRAKDAQELDLLITDLQTRIQLTPGLRDNNTYTISFEDTDRHMSQRVVQTLLSTFVDDTLGFKRSDTEGAQRFLEEQIRDYEQRLRSAEDRLAAFKREHVGLMPGETGDYYTRLEAEMSSLESLRAKHRQLSERHDELMRQMEGEEPTFGLVSPSSKAGVNDAKIADLETKLEKLLISFTEKHPEVIALRENIERLKDENQQGPAPTVAATPDNLRLQALDINPVYQSMKIAVSTTAADLADMRAQVAEQERKVAVLRARVTTIPEVEAQLAQLNRDYEVNKAQYTSLVQRLESARISEQAEQSTDKIKFRIIEPPVVPLLASGPPRAILFSIVLVVALGIAGGVALLMHQLNPVFSTRGAVRSITGLNVLGSISMAWHEHLPWHGRQPVRFAASLVLLFVVYLGALAAR
jgi:polysaccharide chain length determinant protein (PEP-CTERM system associated)